MQRGGEISAFDRITKKGGIVMALVTTKEMFEKAYKGKYAIGAFNVNNMEIVQGIVEGARAQKSPVILQVSKGALEYAGPKYLKAMVDAAVADVGIDIALHLDHGPDIDTIKICVENGFTSVMFDGSHYDYKENVRKTREVVEYAHAHGVVVEAELGVLAGVEDDVKSDMNIYTDPDQAVEFVNITGVDSLAIAIGTSHGAFKFPMDFKPELRFDILEEIQRKLPGFPIVLHGASAVDPDTIEICNKYGAKIAGAKGIPVDMLRKASLLAVCKINMDTDLRLAMTAGIRKVFAEKPSEIDPRKYLGEGRKLIRELVEKKIVDVLGSDNTL
ncbi:fructose-1,6-bisphosphate aldolase [Clostridium scatologenes]|uniref:Fructose-1,6-bisphosphate aldolase n=2 Tax=Clostridium scatologenes TaxID=1548 RepID=A0A0E3M6D5_CLOSL|nr:fructose-1,6-bisphosphate aldolase [Clostridium scatologenes]